jgi:hypothetical protein
MTMTRYALLALALLFAATAHATDTPPATALPPITKHNVSKDFKQEKRALNPKEVHAVATLNARSLEIVQRYLPGVSAESITAHTLDLAYDAWLKDARADKPSPDRVIPAFGVRLGTLTLKSCRGDWLHVKDNYGEAVAIEFGRSGQQIYPVDSVNKRYSRGERNFFASLSKLYLIACNGKLK